MLAFNKEACKLPLNRKARRMKRLLVIGLLLAPTPTLAGFVNGNELLGWCAADSHRADCRAYVMGIADTLASTLIKRDFIACTSVGVTAGQLGDIVRRWLEKNPKVRHASAEGLVATALIEAFPCPK
jgi:hypothetical protein